MEQPHEPLACLVIALSGWMHGMSVVCEQGRDKAVCTVVWTAVREHKAVPDMAVCVLDVWVVRLFA